VMDSGSHGG